MKTNDQIRQFITTEILSSSQTSLVGDLDPLIESGIIDSYGIMSLIAFIEKEFGIQLGSGELMPENFENVSAISALVDKKIGERAEAA